MSLSIKQWAVSDRPREKFLSLGNKQLSDAELLAIIISNGTRGATALDIAKSCLAEHGNSLRKISKLRPNQIINTKGIGMATAIKICAALEFGNRLNTEKNPVLKKISSSHDAYLLLSPIIGDLQNEEFWILLLNRANQVIRKERISVGGVSGTVVDAKIIFSRALACLASSIILAHNHPSGQTRPSEEDIRVTKKITEAGKSLDIRVLDHLIIGSEKYYSFADEGII